MRFSQSSPNQRSITDFWAGVDRGESLQLARQNVPVQVMQLFALISMIVLLGEISTSAQQPHPFLRDDECGSARILVTEIGTMRIYATCSTFPDARVVNFTVDNPSTLLLDLFSIRFCGNPIIAVQSPRGWKSETTNGDVRWTSVEEVPGGNGWTGFSVALTPGWRLSSVVGVGWRDAGSSSASGGVSGVTGGCA
jgi:hypothetical protein